MIPCYIFIFIAVLQKNTLQSYLKCIKRVILHCYRNLKQLRHCLYFRYFFLKKMFLLQYRFQAHFYGYIIGSIYFTQGFERLICEIKDPSQESNPIKSVLPIQPCDLIARRCDGLAAVW